MKDATSTYHTWDVTYVCTYVRTYLVQKRRVECNHGLHLCQLYLMLYSLLLSGTSTFYTLLLTEVQQPYTAAFPHLEVDDDGKDEDGGREVGEVGKVGTLEGLTEPPHFVSTSCKNVEQSYDGTFKLSA